MPPKNGAPTGPVFTGLSRRGPLGEATSVLGGLGVGPPPEARSATSTSSLASRLWHPIDGQSEPFENRLLFHGTLGCLMVLPGRSSLFFGLHGPSYRKTHWKRWGGSPLPFPLGRPPALSRRGQPEPLFGDPSLRHGPHKAVESLAWASEGPAGHAKNYSLRSPTGPPSPADLC